ncbi:ACP phosphodiesterase [Thaumasiovibrio subtropicus]|uniref:acyl carrier protein phosphodiesterase n=1 Tax=Thaumasiovibrio subtropicus TaxID=1891207 RepID=UPI000B3517F6|nr:ACP phosphodiesterase [Thaumasiovibrio subtropicus]
MNYLAHLHLAELANSHLAANLLADFVRGKPEGRFSSEVVQGIYLHRFIDGQVDSTQQVKAAKQYFPPSLRRFSGIALDMFWDHFLAVHWHQYHDKTLNNFLHHAELQITQYHPPHLPERYVKLQQMMWQGRWLESYQQTENIRFALQRISLRRPRFQPLADCGDYLEKHYDSFEALFFSLYPEMMNRVLEWKKKR